MLKSMTAYSRIQKRFTAFDIFFELQSVNRKHLDIQCQLPKELLPYENDVRSLISDFISRGQIIANCHIAYRKPPSFDVQLFVPLAHKLRGAIEQLAKELDLQALMNPELLLGFLQREEVIQVKPRYKVDAATQKALLETASFALKGLEAMKIREGKHLSREFEQRLKVMKVKLRAIEKRVPIQHGKYTHRLKELSGGGVEVAEALARHVASYADKVDISEEISRFSYHLDHIAEILHAKESSGKLIEFVLQELLREANTMGSKSQDTLITKNIILIKNEIEKMREQIQNVE